MNVSPEKTLALVEVTRLVFRTKSPTEQQVARVQKLMQSGLLPDCHCSGPPVQWTTTTGAIADYLARESLKRNTAKHSEITGTRAPAPSLFDGSVPEPADDAQLKSLYKGIWSDYFLTVFMQRKAVNRSVAFGRAVLAGQVLMLVLIVLAMISAVRLTTLPVPPQRAAVERWIEEHSDEYSIRNWFPPVPASDGEGVVLRVQYSYELDSPKPIVTDRSFLVVDDEASLIVETD